MPIVTYIRLICRSSDVYCDARHNQTRAQMDTQTHAKKKKNMVQTH